MVLRLVRHNDIYHSINLWCFHDNVFVLNFKFSLTTGVTFTVVE